MATISSRPDKPSRSAIAKAGGITSGVTWVSVGRCTSHMVTAVTRYPFKIVAPASDRRSPPMTLLSLDCASADARAASCCVSSPRCPATAHANVSSRTFLQWSRTCPGRSSYCSDAANPASTSVTFSDIHNSPLRKPFFEGFPDRAFRDLRTHRNLSLDCARSARQQTRSPSPPPTCQSLLEAGGLLHRRGLEH